MLDDTFNPEFAVISTRAANEGIPVAAIARIVQYPYDTIAMTLREALSVGKIGAMPKPDWPPTAKWADRLPTVPRTYNSEDVEFAVKKTFHLTNLEAAFMVVLLHSECADKEKLHNVIERQRFTRQQRPDNLECTDPKMVDVIICKLRKKLKLVDEAVTITTSWGNGYYFDPAVKRKIFELIGGMDACGPVAEREENTGDVD